MESLTTSIDLNDPNLLAEAEVGLTFRLCEIPLRYYSDSWEHCAHWTFVSKPSGLPFAPRLFGIIGKFTGGIYDLGAGPKVYPVLQLIYPNKVGDRLSSTFFNQLQVLQDQMNSDKHDCECNDISAWSTGPIDMSTDGGIILVFMHREAILTGVEVDTVSTEPFLVDDVTGIVKSRFGDNRFLKVGALIEATVSLHRIDVTGSGNRHYSIVADKIEVLQQHVNIDLGVVP